MVGDCRRDRVFCAREIIDILKEPARLTPEMGDERQLEIYAEYPLFRHEGV